MSVPHLTQPKPSKRLGAYLSDFSIQAALMGLLAAFVGFASSFAVVLKGLLQVGASPDQAATGLMVLAIMMGVSAIGLSLYTRMPISIAWSTPGAALLISSEALDGGFSAAVGAFMVCGGLLVLTGLVRPLGRLVRQIPSPLANAMLAGILISLCLAPIKAIEFNPLWGITLVAAWLLGGRVHRLLGVPAALLALVGIMVFAVSLPEGSGDALLSNIIAPWQLVRPSFSLEGVLGIALPLYLVTMASQNLPGLTILSAHHYSTDTRLLIGTTGIFSALGAFLGAHAVNLAAITAALCASEDAHAHRDKRYWAAIVGGLFYIVLGLCAGLVTGFVAIAPGVFIESVAGLALIGAFSNAAVQAFSDPASREAAAITFLVTASGVSFYGVSGAFWGLLAGLFVLMIAKKR